MCAFPSLVNPLPTCYSRTHDLLFDLRAQRGLFDMVQEETGAIPQRGVLLRRAHELLESLGHPATEELLIQHLLGVSGSMVKPTLWSTLLRQTLRCFSLFEVTG